MRKKVGANGTETAGISPFLTGDSHLSQYFQYPSVYRIIDREQLLPVMLRIDVCQQRHELFYQLGTGISQDLLNFLLGYIVEAVG